jgi:23S rRNA (guanosine2251-2'-O)-methyltransferase
MSKMRSNVYIPRTPEIRVLLHNIRSAHNVGSMLRTSDALGVGHVYLSGYTPLPRDRFGRPVKEIAKTALGAEESVPWSSERDVSRVIARCKQEGYVVVGLEQDARAVDYKHYSPKTPVLFIVGNEVRGMSPALRAQCDVLVEIPMRGRKESLNVAVSFGVALFRIVGQ